ncbi:YtzH-like family protein [Bacillus aquiflavi]|uniref:YtzH-like family protein n=1 Tax=Bacillus aquiflavi TaxID=2672567 RepID=UPI002868034A|nr:YtzH-like family protein [Bacillus aquiflavi]
MIALPLNYEDQINLLTDILKNHQADCCGSPSEYEQLGRLVKSLTLNCNIDQSVKSVLKEIEEYSQNGLNSTNINQHIENYQMTLSQWVSSFKNFS